MRQTRVDQRLEFVDLSRLQLGVSGGKCGEESDAESFGECAVDKSAGLLRVSPGSNGVADAVLLHIGQLRDCESDKLLDPAAVVQVVGRVGHACEPMPAYQLRTSRPVIQRVLAGLGGFRVWVQKRGNRLQGDGFQAFLLKRTTGFEPATPGLGSQCSTN